MLETQLEAALGTTDPLKPAQRRRVEALKEARDILAARSVFGQVAASGENLLLVAEYILKGGE